MNQQNVNSAMTFVQKKRIIKALETFNREAMFQKEIGVDDNDNGI